MAIVKAVNGVNILLRLHQSKCKKDSQIFSVVALFRYYLRRGFSEEKILNIGTSLCTSMKLQTSVVCESGIHLFGSKTMNIAKQVEMTAAEVCYFILGDFCAETAENPLHQWNISFPSNPKPEIQTIELPMENAPKLKVLHLADTHYDPWYVEGSNADCNEPLCCRQNGDGIRNAPSIVAGKWGSFKCDLPKRTLEHLLDHLWETHKVKPKFESNLMHLTGITF